MTTHNEILRLEVSGPSARRNGKTTALVDIAIANAQLGKTVEYWSPNRAMAQYALTMVSKRYAGAHHAQLRGMSIHFFDVSSNTVGRINFMHGEGSDIRAIRHGLPMYSYTDVLIEDLEGPTGNVSIRTGRKLPGLDPTLR